jgi:ABC-type dipeptide/oligopeptide/nickel transport system permease subunit
MFTELLPNLASTLLVFFPLIVANAVLLEAALSFLGAGVQPPEPSWGVMISEGIDFLTSAPHLTIAPGVMLVLTVLSLNIFGEGLRDALDPRAKIRLEHLMARFIIRRLIGMVLVLFAVSVITFLIFNVIPNGDPAVRMAGKNSTPVQIEAIRKTWHFDDSLPEQYWYTMKQVFSGNLISYSDQTNVWEEIKKGMPRTFALAIGAAILWMTLAVALGLYSAVRAGKFSACRCPCSGSARSGTTTSATRPGGSRTAATSRSPRAASGSGSTT